jgi:short-subunit dehydrogenase
MSWLFYLVILGIFIYAKRILRKKKLEQLDLPRSYAGKRIFITGASSGIGKELALQYAEKGAKVALVARREAQLLDLANKCKEKGCEDVHVVAADISNQEDCKKAIQETVEKFGGIDILLLNAGKSALIKFEEVQELKEYKNLMEVNYWANVNLTYLALPHLLKCAEEQKHPKIIVVSSLAGKSGVPYRTAYSPTKFALHGFYDSLRFEIGDRVQISLVCPGYVLTEIHDVAYTNKKLTRNYSKFQTAGDCAREIIEAEFLGTRELIMSPLASALTYARMILPDAVLDKVIKQKAESGFANN